MFSTSGRKQKRRKDTAANSEAPCLENAARREVERFRRDPDHLFLGDSQPIERSSATCSIKEGTFKICWRRLWHGRTLSLKVVSFDRLCLWAPKGLGANLLEKDAERQREVQTNIMHI